MCLCVCARKLISVSVRALEQCEVLMMVADLWGDGVIWTNECYFP